jgi:zinc-ribbon domain
VPYCRKCGAKLDDNARYCRVCGTAVAPILTSQTPTASGQQGRPVRRPGFPLALTIIIVVAVLIVAALVVAVIPFQHVSFSQSNEASARDVNTFRLILNSDIATVNIIEKDLPGTQRAATNISATGWRGLFGTDNPLALSFSEDTNTSTLTWFVTVSRAAGWSALNTINVVCDVYVDPSLPMEIQVHTNTGAITLNADKEATFQDLVLQANTGSVVANLSDGTVVTNRAVLEATTGGVLFAWENAKVPNDASVDLRASTGSVNVNLTQTGQLQGNVTLNAQTSTGGVNLNVSIQNDVGARISASTGLGGIDVNQKGFSGNQVPLQSSNYPAASDFDVTLRTSLGGININANYELGGTRT